MSSYGTEAYDINNSDKIVGYYRGNDGKNHGFLYNNGTWTSLNYPGSIWTETYGINDSNKIVGFYIDTTYQGHGFLYDYDNDTWTSLDFDYPSTFDTHAYNINNSGEIVGWYFDWDAPNSEYRGFLYDMNTSTSLDYPGTWVTSAYGINDAGRIVGGYLNYYYDDHGFVASPVPEPSTLLLLASGLAGVIALRKRLR